jgi:hypothetical protein
MSYWAREVAGWVLIALGLIIFWNSYTLLLARRVFETGPLVFVGFVVFRGGVHLLKVAVAAQAARSLPEEARPPARRGIGPPQRPVGPTPVKSVVPGPATAAQAAGRRPAGAQRRE